MKFGDSALSRGLIIRLVAGRSHLSNFVQYLISLSGKPEAVSHTISDRSKRPTVAVLEKFGPKLSEAVLSAVLSNCDKC